MKKKYTYSFLFTVILTLFSFFPLNKLSAQYCSLTCIENVQVSVGLDCEATINYRMILNDPDNPATCSPNGPAAYKIVVMDKDGGPISSNPTVSCDFIGQTLRVKAQHWLTGNSCWSNLKVEDKIAPRLECGEAITISCNANIASTIDGGVIPSPIITNTCKDSCDSFTYTYEDKTTTYTCEYETSNKGVVAKIERNWTVCDGSNNCGTCTQLIYIKNVDIADIHIPEPATINCEDVCDVNDPFCVAQPTLNGEPVNTGFCNIQLTYRDVVTEGCMGTSTIKRIWSIVNPCTKDSINPIQTIEIVDNTPPTITCSSDPATIQLDHSPFSCGAIIEVPAAVVVDDCSSLSNLTIHTSVYQLNEDGTQSLIARYPNLNGGFSENVMIGRVIIVYEAIDDCGNTISNMDDPCIIEVVDNIAPTPICNGSTRLSISNGDKVSIFAKGFDSGSYDNCCIQEYQARRMDQPNSAFEDYVDFTCADAGQTTLVVLRIYDCSGNFADCMVEAIIDDKVSPKIISCPETVFFNCTDGITLDLLDASVLGEPTFEDNCSLNNVSTTFAIKQDERNGCGLGDVIYEWTVTDFSGNNSTCEQTISFFDDTGFDVSFPADFEPERCYGLAELVPALTGEPIISETDCEIITVSYEDIVTSKEDICRRVSRTWTITNNCAIDPEESALTHVQIIAIKDTEAPIVDCGTTNISVCIDNDACGVEVDVAGITVQDCDSDAFAPVDWTFTPADGCSGEIITGKVTNAMAGFTTPRFGPGTLSVIFNVSDDCGNTTICSREYIIKDCKAPSISCKSGIVLPLEEDGKAVFWAKDFDEKSFDNCATCLGGELLFSFSTNVGDSSKVYTCADIGEQSLTIYVADVAGNQTFCETNIFIQSPNGVCGTTTGGTTTGGTTTGGTTTGGTTTGGTTTICPISGTACDDGNASTINDIEDGNCNCAGTSCPVAGTACNDGNASTINDTEDGNCNCAGTSCPVAGTVCDDGNASTIDDLEDGNCNCLGITGGTTGVPIPVEDDTDGGTTGGGTTTGGAPIPIGDGTEGGTTTGGTTDTGGTPPNGLSMGLECGSTTEVCINENTCTKSVNVVALKIEDYCGGSVGATAIWKFEPASNCTGESRSGVVSGAMNGFTSEAFGPGTFSLTFEVIDACGNKANCERTYEIVDCQAPTARCLNGLTLGLGSDGTVEFWAKDFDQGSQDNCSHCGPSELFFSFSEIVGDSSITFDCSDVGIQSIDLFITDIAGNQTSCTVNFTVSGVAACDEGFTTVEGNIVTQQGKQVSFVDMALEDIKTGISNKIRTAADGHFVFEAPMSGNYMLKTERSDNIDNGVSIFDLVLLRKHITGHTRLSTPYQLIAADINNSGTITAADMVALRKAILHLTDQFPNNTSWRFIEADYDFKNPAQPTQEVLPQEINIPNLQKSQSIELIAIKVGDLNGNAKIGELQTNQPRTSEQLLLTVEDRQLKKGEVYDITFTADRMDIQGVQFTMKHQAEELQFLSMQASEQVAAENIGDRFANKGLLTFGWNKKAGINDPLTYTIRVQAQRDGMLSQVLSLSSSLTPIEAFTTTGEIVNIQLNYQRTGLPFELMQNTPNPFAENTVIPFTLPKRDLVKLMVVNTAGKILWQIEQEFEKGYHEVPVNEIHTSGVLYYRIKTGSKIASKKMIRLE